jgi:hypothetical protein
VVRVIDVGYIVNHGCLMFVRGVIRIISVGYIDLSQTANNHG